MQMRVCTMTAATANANGDGAYNKRRDDARRGARRNGAVRGGW